MGTRARAFSVERGGMAKEMSSNLFRMFQFGVEDRRTYVRTYVGRVQEGCRVQESRVIQSRSTALIAAVHAIGVIY